MKHNCILCNGIHIAIDDEHLPQVCVICYKKLYANIPDYIPEIQKEMWVERKV